MPFDFEFPTVMHLGTIDAFIQTLFPGIISAEERVKDAMVPTSIKAISVVAQCHKPRVQFSLASKSEKHQDNKISSMIVAKDLSSNQAILIMEGLVYSRLPKIETVEETALRACHRTEWVEKTIYLSSRFGTSPAIIISSGNDESNPLRLQLKQSLLAAGCQIVEDCSTPPDKVCIVLRDEHTNTLNNPTAAQYQNLKTILLDSKAVLWISNGATYDCPNSEQSLITGLARAIHLENSAPITTFDLDAVNKTSPVRTADLAVSILYQTIE